MSQLDYAAIRAQIPIRRVLDLLSWEPIRRRGDQWRGQCPLLCSGGSSRTPCFSVHISRQLFQCFTCHKSGNQLDLWAAVTGQPLYQATRDLCRRLGVEPATRQNPQPPSVHTILFKLFNKIETWELLNQELGDLSYDSYSFERYDPVLSDAMDRKQAIYSAAYIMPSGSRENGSTKKHRSHLRLLERMMDDGVPDRIPNAASMRDAFNVLVSYPMIGDFLAYQYVTDLNYSEICDFTEMEFVVPGPGAIDGISKCFSSRGGLTETDIINLVTERQVEEFDRLGLEFQSLWGRRLQLIDCQNLFCEISKYARVRHPKVDGVANRTRIKQKYKPNLEPLSLWYPPKWGINDKIPPSLNQAKDGDYGVLAK